MANICSYRFTPKSGEAQPFHDPQGYDQEVHDGAVTGSRKWSPPLEELMTLKVSGRLEWEEHAFTGLGYYDLEDGVIINEVAISTPNNLTEAVEAWAKYPALKPLLRALISAYLDEDDADEDADEDA